MNPENTITQIKEYVSNTISTQTFYSNNKASY